MGGIFSHFFWEKENSQAEGGNAVPNGQQKQKNVLVKHVIEDRGCCHGLYTVAFSNGFFKLTDLNILMLAMTMRFPALHTEERKLTLLLINQRWRERGMNMIKGR